MKTKYVITIVDTKTNKVFGFVAEYPEKIEETESCLEEFETMFVNEL